MQRVRGSGEWKKAIRRSSWISCDKALMGRRGSYNKPKKKKSPAISSSVASGNGPITWIHLPADALPATVGHLGLLWECFPLSPRESYKGWREMQHLVAQSVPADKLPSLLLPHVFADLVILSFFCCPQHTKNSLGIKWLWFIFPRQMEVKASFFSFSICSYQQRFIQLPCGIFVTLEKTLMTFVLLSSLYFVLFLTSPWTTMTGEVPISTSDSLSFSCREIIFLRQNISKIFLFESI